MQKDKHKETITFGSGCFWCTEAIFARLKGVIKATPGYSGGKTENPSYEQVSTGATGHAEVVQIDFDPTVISLDELIEIFFFSHDPTTLNRQGADVGSQYRSVVFYHTEDQRKAVLAKIQELEAKRVYISPIITKLESFKAFYPAEEYHINYYEKNRSQLYSKYVIDPKINKLEKKFESNLKK